MPGSKCRSLVLRVKPKVLNWALGFRLCLGFRVCVKFRVSGLGFV